MKGSKYAILRLVESPDFIDKMNLLIASSKARISVFDNWMPKSIWQTKEAELNDFLKYNFSVNTSKSLTNWWLKHNATTPNWDLISTCTIGGKRGILLVEAKAHYDELKKESKGKNINHAASANSKENHQHIGLAIIKANNHISKKYSGVAISRDNCYQLSNRLAHAWWLANKGIPVVLMYLGFLKCEDMSNGKRQLFYNDLDWQDCFVEHAKQVGVDKIVDKWVDCGESGFVTICRSV